MLSDDAFYERRPFRLDPVQDAAASLDDEDGRFPPFEGEPAGRKAERPRFPMLLADDLEIGDDPVWLIDGLLPATGYAVVYGPPKAGKSFLLADALFHVAMGRTWAGRDVQQGVVIYICAEGIKGFERRVIAMRRHHGVEGQRTPFVTVPRAPNFGHASGDDAALIEDIEALLATIGNPPVRAIAVDTLARTMFGADENLPKDMMMFAGNCERVASAFGCVAIAVHHAGKDLSKGARGSNSIDAAVDAMWLVEKGDACSTATVVHQKDGEAGATWQFRLIPKVLREASAAVQSAAAAVVEIIANPGDVQQPAAVRSKPLPDRPRHLLEILKHALNEMGEFLKGDPNVPHDTRSISRDHLKKYLSLKGYWESSNPNGTERANLSRDISVLLARHVAGGASGRLWLA